MLVVGVVTESGLISVDTLLTIVNTNKTTTLTRVFNLSKYSNMLIFQMVKIMKCISSQPQSVHVTCSTTIYRLDDESR